MPASDVLNPTAGWDPVLGDSINPSYTFKLNRPSTLLVKKPIGGYRYGRETQNTGHIFNLGWVGRTWPTIQMVKWYYEQYENGGFFTFKNWDSGGREYVGSFTSISDATETANNKWNIDAVFEEMPGAPMVNYPSDWNHESVLFQVNNDEGDQQLATNVGAWTETTTATFPAITLGGRLRGTGSGALPLSNVVMTNPGTAGDWATIEYRGYGFQLWLCEGPEFGKCDVYLDEVLVTTVDCYGVADVGPQMVLSQPNVSLDIHRVTVSVDGTKNSSSTGTNITWFGLQVMR